VAGFEPGTPLGPPEGLLALCKWAASAAAAAIAAAAKWGLELQDAGSKWGLGA